MAVFGGMSPSCFMRWCAGLAISISLFSGAVAIFGASGGAELDPGFNANIFIGGREGYFNHGVRTMALQADGKILIGGNFTNVNGAVRHSLARLNADGTLDETFAPTGTTNDFVRSIVVQADGKILFTGGAQPLTGSHQTTVVRLHGDGSRDAEFHVPACWGVSQILLGRDGMIYICGTFGSVDELPRRYLARLHPNGVLDESYAPPVVGHPSTEGGMVHIAQQADSKILLAGMFSTTNGGGIFERFNMDGSEDASFRGSGVYFCSGLQVLPGGQILHVASTQFNSEYAVLRVFDSSGNRVASFEDRNQIPGHLEATLLQPDGKIIFGGQFINSTINYGKHLARINPDGSLDRSFDVGSGFALAPGSKDYQVYANALAFQPDGKILVGGQFHRYDGQPRTNLVRLMGQRVFARQIEMGAGGALVLRWEILGSRETWKVQSTEDLLSWTTVKEKVDGGLVELQETAKSGVKFFRVVPEE